MRGIIVYAGIGRAPKSHCFLSINKDYRQQFTYSNRTFVSCQIRLATFLRKLYSIGQNYLILPFLVVHIFMFILEDK